VNVQLFIFIPALGRAVGSSPWRTGTGFPRGIESIETILNCEIGFEDL